jgi:hypothetical protein
MTSPKQIQTTEMGKLYIGKSEELLFASSFLKLGRMGGKML